MCEIKSNLDFKNVSDALVELKAFTDPSEAHGLMCGFICAGAKADDIRWLEPILGNDYTAEILFTPMGQVLQSLFDISFHQLQSFEFDLLLLMPDEEEDIQYRSESLGLWCQGLLAGLALADSSIRQNLSEDLQTTLQDLTKITWIDVDNIEQNEESEEALMSVVEYVRMATLLIHSILNTPAHTPTTSESYHIH